MKYSVYVLLLLGSLLIGCKRSQLAQLQSALSPVDWNEHFVCHGDKRVLFLPKQTISWETIESIGVSKPAGSSLRAASKYELTNQNLTLPCTLEWEGDDFGPTQVTIRGPATTIVPGRNLMLLLQTLSGQSPDLQILQEFHVETISPQFSAVDRIEFHLCVAGQVTPLARIELKLPRKDGTVTGYRLRLGGR